MPERPCHDSSYEIVNHTGFWATFLGCHFTHVMLSFFTEGLSFRAVLLYFMLSFMPELHFWDYAQHVYCKFKLQNFLDCPRESHLISRAARIYDYKSIIRLAYTPPGTFTLYLMGTKECAECYTQSGTYDCGSGTGSARQLRSTPVHIMGYFCSFFVGF